MVTKKTPSRAGVEERAARGRAGHVKVKAKASAAAPSPAAVAPGPAARVAGKILNTQRALIQASLRAVMPKGQPSKTGATPWRFTSLEDVFDQRIAAALERLGVPTSDQFEVLTARLDQAIKRLDALDTKRRR
jgi:hypothetical protein